jgi:acyl-coenzyme A thioesterase PaaI-like protein
MASFEPSDPAWEPRVRASFARQPMMETIGARLERVAPGEVDIRVPFRAAISQHHGFVHAGAITTAVDTACGYAALTRDSTEQSEQDLVGTSPKALSVQLLVVEQD